MDSDSCADEDLALAFVDSPSLLLSGPDPEPNASTLPAESARGSPEAAGFEASPKSPPHAKYAALTREVLAYSAQSARDFRATPRGSSAYSPEAQRRPSVPWTADEDAVLTELVARYHGRSWRDVAAEMRRRFPARPHRTCNQCNQRWTRVLDPGILKGKWTDEEDRRLYEALAASPPRRWKLVADKMPGRTDIQVRYRARKIRGKLAAMGLGAEYLE